MKRLVLLVLMSMCLMSAACAVNPHDPDVMASRYQEGMAYYASQDYARAYAILKPLALKGHANAQYYVGLMNFQGQGTILYPQEGAVMLFNAAQQGHADAMYKLAMAYGQSAGVLPNQERALFWISRSAEAAYMTSTGWKFSVIPAKGQIYPITRYWFHKTVAPNDYAMLYEIAQRYRLGSGVEQDLRRAANMYHHLALVENAYQADAQFELGIMFYAGNGVDRNIAQARGWLELAAANGHVLAAQELAELNSNFPASGQEEPFTPELMVAPEPALEAATTIVDDDPLNS